MRRVLSRERASRVTVLVVVLAFSLSGVIAAIAATPHPAIDTFTPHHERDITNLDVLRQQIRNY